MPTPELSREAHRHLEQAVEGAPDNPEFHLDFCVALGDLDRVDDSIGLYRTALALAPETPAALANLGFALRDRGKAQAYRGAIGVHPYPRRPAA